MQEMEEDGGDESDEEIRELKRRFVSDVISKCVNSLTVIKTEPPRYT